MNDHFLCNSAVVILQPVGVVYTFYMDIVKVLLPITRNFDLISSQDLAEDA